MDFKITNGLYLDLATWIHDSNIHDKLYRVWFKNPKWNGLDINSQYTDEMCEYMFFTELIILPDNDMLIGMQPLDEDSENRKYPMIEYRKLSEIDFTYYEKDNEEIWFDNTYDDTQILSDEEYEKINQAYKTHTSNISKYVYCTECKHFTLIKEGDDLSPNCTNKNKHSCCFWDVEDGKKHSERRYYKPSEQPTTLNG